VGAMRLEEKTVYAQRRQVAIWMVVYLLIPMLFFGLHFFLVAADARKNYLMDQAATEVSETCNHMDSVIRSVDRQAISATLDYTIQEYLYNDSEEAGKTEGYERYLMGMAKSIQSSRNEISSVYIWLGDKGVVAVSGGIYETEDFYDTWWLDYASDLHVSNNVITPCRTIVTPNNRKTDVISGIWAIRPQTYKEEINNFVVINFNLNKLMGEMSQTIHDGENLFVLDSAGQEVMGNAEALSSLLPPEEYWQYVNHYVTELYSGERDYITASVVSTYCDWTYLLLSQTELPVLPDSGQMFNMYVNMMLLMAVLLALINYRYYYAYLRAREKTKFNGSGHWYLLQNVAGMEDIVKSLGYRQFVILCMSLDETEQPGNAPFAEQLKQIGEAVENARKPPGMPEVTMIVKGESDEYVLLCANAEEGDAVEPLLEWCRSYAANQFHQSVSIGMSQAHAISDTDITMAVVEAKEALKYRFCTGRGSVLSYEKNVKTNHCYYYISDVKRSAITNSLINRQFEGAKEGIEEIIGELKEQKGIFYSNARIVLHMLLDIVISVMRIRKYRPETVERSFDEIYNEMNRCVTMDDAIDLVMNTLELYRKCMEKERLTHDHTDPVDIMLDYINENYDKDIKLKTFVEMTYFSESHLSRIFKNRTGENYLSYLTKKRVEAAKRMLKETDMKVSEIAKALSFNDSKTFIRAFEKYEKVTPGRYRHQSRMRENDD